MNREIKFRAKRIDNGEWVYGSYVKAECLNSKWKYEHFIIEVNADGQTYSVDENTICQFTELNDKNDKEIYEGDIVSYIDNLCKIKFVASVKYDAPQFELWCNNEDFCGIGVRKSVKGETEIEVLGNIFENLEFLVY